MSWIRRHADTNRAGPSVRPAELLRGPDHENQSPFISYPQLMNTGWPNRLTARALARIEASCDPELIARRLVPCHEMSGIRPWATSHRSSAAGNICELPDHP